MDGHKGPHNDGGSSHQNTHTPTHTKECTILGIEKYFKYWPTLNIFCKQQILKSPSIPMLIPPLIETGPQQIHSKCIYITPLHHMCTYSCIPNGSDSKKRNLQCKYKAVKYPSPNSLFIQLHKIKNYFPPLIIDHSDRLSIGYAELLKIGKKDT